MKLTSHLDGRSNDSEGSYSSFARMSQLLETVFKNSKRCLILSSIQILEKYEKIRKIRENRKNNLESQENNLEIQKNNIENQEKF